MTTNEALAAHTETCQAHNIDMALENGASLIDDDVEARTWAAIYLDDSEMCICNH